MSNYFKNWLRTTVPLSTLLVVGLTPGLARAQYDLTPTFKSPLAASPWRISSLTQAFYNGGSEPYNDGGWDTIYGFAFGFSSTYNSGKPYFMVARVFNGASNNSNTGGVCVFNSDIDNQAVPAPLKPLQTPIGLASIGGRVFGAFRSNYGVSPTNAADSITEIKPDGTNGESIGFDLSSVNLLTVNPRNGHLLASSLTTNTVLDVDVNAKTVTTLMTMQEFNGLAITGSNGLATDGVNLFINVFTSDGTHVEQFPIPASNGQTVKSVKDFGSLYGARGLVLGLGGASGYLYVHCLHGQDYQIDRATNAISLLANRYVFGNNSEVAGVDPITGTLLVGGLSVYRLTPPAANSFQYTIPTVAASTVASGKTISATVYLAVPAPVDFVVTLTPSANVKLSTSRVTIKAGTTAANFAITGGTVTTSSPAYVATTISLPMGNVTQTVSLMVTPH